MRRWRCLGQRSALTRRVAATQWSASWPRLVDESRGCEKVIAAFLLKPAQISRQKPARSRPKELARTKVIHGKIKGQKWKSGTENWSGRKKRSSRMAVWVMTRKTKTGNTETT